MNTFERAQFEVVVLGVKRGVCVNSLPMDA